MAKTGIFLAMPLFVMILASQAAAAETLPSNIVSQLAEARPNAPLQVSIYISSHGDGNTNNIGLASSELMEIRGKNTRIPREYLQPRDRHLPDLDVIGADTLTGTCSMITRKRVEAGQRNVAVESCSPFWNVKKVLLHQTQGSAEEAGRYEFADIRFCSKKILHLQHPLHHGYSSAVVGGSSPRVSQVVPVIQARNIEVCQGGLIQAPKWNDRCGGIITVEAEGNISVCTNSSVSASGAGFRGAPQFVSTDDYNFGFVGESEAIGYGVRRQTAGVGSGGGSSVGNSGGYGGAHAAYGSAPTGGGCGRPAERPSLTLSSSGNGRSYFGGSGGASGSHNLLGRDGAKGGASGGMVVMIAKGWIKTASASSVQANGMAGQDGYIIPGGLQAMGGGGGGAGGSVLYKEGNSKFRFQASVNGGAGGAMVVFGGSCGNSGQGGTGGKGTVAVLA